MEGSHHHGGQCCCAQGHETGGHEECCGQVHEHSSTESHCCGHEQEGGRLRRRFHSRDERLARLEEYRKDLQEELKGVEERIAQMRAGT
jgi:hypothetical protein